MQITLKASLVQVLGLDSGGVSCTVALTLEDHFTFESVYWTHPNTNRAIVVEPRFLLLFGVEETEQLPFYADLLQEVATSLPSVTELLKNIPTNDNH